MPVRATAVLLFIVIASVSRVYGDLSNDHVRSKNSVIGDYTPLRLEGVQVVLPPTSTCHDYARSTREPYTTAYQQRNNLDELQGDTRLAFWNWSAQISREKFEAAAAMQRIVTYKIVDRKVYVAANTTDTPAARRQAVEELMELSAYLYPLPDMDILMHLWDHHYDRVPVISFCARRGNQAFTMPSSMPWLFALGPMQMSAYHACLWDRYPLTDRLPVVGWRGTSRGYINPLKPEDCLKLPRVRMHLLARQHTDVLDARLNQLYGPCQAALQTLLNGTDDKERTATEDFNRYCAVMDMDGNTWSDRFQGFFAHYPTPVLKQSSNITGYAEHFFAPGDTLETFEPDLSDVVEKARKMVADCRRGGASAGQAMARRAQATARQLFSHVGIIRAMAYALLNYHRFASWKVDRSLEGFERVKAASWTNSTLPPELLAALARR